VHLLALYFLVQHLVSSAAVKAREVALGIKLYRNVSKINVFGVSKRCHGTESRNARPQLNMSCIIPAPSLLMLDRVMPPILQ